MNRMKWLVAFGTLLLAAGCGPMEPEESFDTPPSSEAQAEDAPGTLGTHQAAATCAQQCQTARNKCINGCSTAPSCHQGCRVRYELCILDC